MTEPRDDDAHRAPQDEHFDEQVRTVYRRGREGDAAAQARVLSRLQGAPEASADGRARGLRWWFSLQPFELRPVWALGVLAVLLAGSAWLGSRLAPTPPEPAPVAAGPDASGTAANASGIPVTFVLRAPGATRVSVAGDFNNWDAEATPMSHSGTGDLWILNMRLPRGVHRYSFVLDGTEWRPDPSAPLAADETFGGHNSVIVVNGAKGL